MGFFTGKDWRDSYRRLPDRELLERIRASDQLAEDYIWVTYPRVVSVHMKSELTKYGKREQLGTPDDYAHDAIIKLLTEVRLLGGAVLKHEYTTIGGWLKQTATNFMRNDSRADDRKERNTLLGIDDAENQTGSRVDTLEDKGADGSADMSQQDIDQRIHRVLDSLPDELQTLIRFKFMEGYSWKETSDLMFRFYPDHKPPFELAYLQKTYWDRVHKKPFIKRLGDELDDLLS